ncbi:helix-turn-helix transcriptional regulator [Macrococcoides canis]|uniref:helix-turn-helix transcriptional regulator n=1 Tax=Macrococcoides canis TaxID=1855823 RepID=UPI001B8A913A|nr:helix-turn-helix transcriptional regulator [Macrococcus canis]QUR94301.1 helix-turn-helix domain-containing protein [Macrococcus canis]UTH07185.1 helix-turn-helix transcriptional regulator [Macrococcus canis]
MNKVKDARIEARITQIELADKVSITRQTVSLIEKGKYNLSLRLCLDICHTLNKTLDELFWVEKGEM